MKRIPLTLIICALHICTYAQVGIGTNMPDSSSALDVQSTTQGMLVPRMTSEQRTLISNPATGLLVFDTNTGGFWLYDGIEWTNLSTRLIDKDGDTKIELDESVEPDTIRFMVEGQDALTIDSLGNLNASGHLESKRYAFSAYRSSSITCNLGQTLIPFNDNTDPFLLFNPATELFTAPVDGLYFFTTTLSFFTPNGSANSSYVVNWVINGSNQFGIITGNGKVDPSGFQTKNTEASCTNSTVINLNAGDTVGVSVTMNDPAGASNTRAALSGFYLGAQ